MKIQKQVDARIRDLEKAHDNPGIEKQEKIKSKRGGNVEVLVQNKEAWPHEGILGARLIRDYLMISLQWRSGLWGSVETWLMRKTIKTKKECSRTCQI